VGLGRGARSAGWVADNGGVVIDGVRAVAGLVGVAPHALHGLVRAGLVAPIRPDRLLGMFVGITRTGLTAAAAAALGAARHPHRPAVIDDAGVLTFAELEADSTAIAAGLHDAYRLGPARTVGVLCRNHRWFVLAVLAASRLGADLVLLNTESAAPQLDAVLAREGVDLLVADDEFADRVAATRFDGPQLRAWQDSADPGADTTRPTPAGHPTPIERPSAADAPSLAALPHRKRKDPGHPQDRPTAAPRFPRQGKVVIMTSGTTGTPKGAPRRPDPLALFGPVAGILTRVPVRTGEPMLIGPPVFHALGLAYLLLGLFVGTPVVLQRRFDPSATLAALHEHRAGSMVAVPVMLARIMELPAEERPAVPSLRAVVSSGSALSPTLAAAFMDHFGEVVHNFYGSSETAWAGLATPAELRSAPGTVGRPPHGTTVRVLDGDGNRVPDGEVGRIFVGSGLAFDGYTGGGGREVVGGLMSTGDLGHVDGAGLLFVDGREDDMIVSGGENVFPQEVEECLTAHADVAEVAVVGVDDERFGQRLAAYVVRRDGATVSADGLRNHVAAELARYKVPRDVEFVDALPRNSTGKVLRRELGT